MTCEQPLPPKNGLSLAALILGILGLFTAPILIGGLIGIIALILGIIALKNPDRRAMAITGIVTGVLAIPMMVIALLIALLIPSLSAARARARETVVAANMKGLVTSMIVYASDNNGAPFVDLTLVPIPPKMLLDPRLNTPPLELPPSDWSSHRAEFDAHCDFYYAGAGIKFWATDSTDLIILYDKGLAGRNRLVAFGDGRVEKFPAGSAELRQAVERNNKARAALKLPPLPLDLLGPPAPPAASSP